MMNVDFAHRQQRFARSLLAAAAKGNTTVSLTVDGKSAKARGKRGQAKRRALRELSEHPNIRVGIFNEDQSQRLGSMPLVNHPKLLVRTAEQGSSTTPLLLCSTGNLTPTSAQEENITSACPMDHPEAEKVIDKMNLRGVTFLG